MGLIYGITRQFHMKNDSYQSPANNGRVGVGLIGGREMNEYVFEYRQKDDAQLQRSLRALSGQPEAKAEKRVRAIKKVMAERMGEVTEQETEKPEDEPKTFDELVARKYISKIDNAKSRGVEFGLTLADMRRLMMRKTCHYTGIRMQDDCDPLEPQKRTLERIDSTQGYTRENTVACCLAANALKNAIFEDPTSLCRMSKAQFKRFVRNV